MGIYDFYPHSEVTVTDNSPATVYQEEQLPLFKPLVILPAQSGEPHTPKWFPTQLKAEQEYGPETFNPANAKYFSPASDFLLDIYGAGGGAFIARAVGADALPAISLICLAVKVGQDIPQWVIDPVTGNYKKVTITTTITTSANVALNATSVSVTALTKAIPANTTLNFGTSVAPKYVVVTAQANIGATSLSISAAASAIASGSVATMTSIEKVPIMSDDATPVQVVEKGATVRYLALNDLVSIGEALDHTFVATTDSGKLQELLAVLTNTDFPTTNINSTVEAVIVPILLVTAKSPGAYGNDLGFTIDYTRAANSASAVAKRNGFIYDFSPFKKNFGTNTTTPIKSIYGSNTFQCAITPDCIDSSTKMQYDLRSIIASSYPAATHNLKMDFFPITQNINLLAAVLAPYEDSIPDLDFKFYETNGTPVADIDGAALQTALDTYQHAGLFNIFGLRNPLGAIYSRIIPLDVNNEAGFFNIGTARYLSLGADGAIFQKENFKQYMIDYLDLSILDIIEDEARFPFSHLIDVGYSPEVKYAMLDFMSVRTNIKVDVGVCVHPKYDDDPTADGVKSIVEDINFGEVLYTRARLVKECLEKGTDTYRASVFAISGYKPKQRYPLGLQWQLAIKRAKFHNKTYLDQLIEEFPNNEVTMFDRFVWIPSTSALKSLTWNTGLNYCEYYDMKRIYCPVLRTVTENETSVLSDFNFADVICYLKLELPKVYRKLAGSTQAANVLQPRLKEEADRRVGALLNKKYRFECRPYQTAADNTLGFIQRVEVQVWSGGTFRLGIFDIVCNREGYNI